MSKVEGKGNIWAEVVCDSVNVWGDRVTTFRLHYPRFIHSEFMTHRMVSKNASSSRAIPVHKQLESIGNCPAKPIHWGLNQPGMQADAEGNVELPWQGEDALGTVYNGGEDLWDECAHVACEYAATMWKDGDGYHKQITNRLTEPFTFMNVVATATDWENFFWLRYHKDAQPEICELARVMYEAREASQPQTLRHGEWHLPYVETFRDSEGMLQYCDGDAEEVYSLEEALKISASCCAQTSYRALDQSLEKALGLFDRLVGGEPLHASPFEHPCCPYSEDEMMGRMQVRKAMEKMLFATGQYSEQEAKKAADITIYTGNFRGWTQYRKTLKNENITEAFSK